MPPKTIETETRLFDQETNKNVNDQSGHIPQPQKSNRKLLLIIITIVIIASAVSVAVITYLNYSFNLFGHGTTKNGNYTNSSSSIKLSSEQLIINDPTYKALTLLGLVDGKGDDFDKTPNTSPIYEAPRKLNRE